MSICRAVEEFKRIRGINKNKTLKLEYAMMFYSDVCYATGVLPQVSALVFGDLSACVSVFERGVFDSEIYS